MLGEIGMLAESPFNGNGCWVRVYCVGKLRKYLIVGLRKSKHTIYNLFTIVWFHGKVGVHTMRAARQLHVQYIVYTATSSSEGALCAFLAVLMCPEAWLCGKVIA